MFASEFRGGANLWRAEIRPTREMLWGKCFSCLKNPLSHRILALLCRRAVAQLGSALEWGSRGRGFESRRPDQVFSSLTPSK
jgi:hypothetical protein